MKGMGREEMDKILGPQNPLLSIEFTFKNGNETHRCTKSSEYIVQLTSCRKLRDHG
jgi:hypothetical protein